MNTPNEEQLQLFSTPEPTLESSFYDWEIDQEGVEKQTKGSGSLLLQDEANKIHLNDNKDTLCSDTSIFFQELEDLPWQQSSLEEYEQLNLWRLTPTLKQSCDRTSQEYQFTQISETTTQSQESLICSQWDSPAQAHQTQEQERDYLIQLPLFGEKDLDALLKLNLASVLSNNLKELSNEDFELFLADSLWQDTLGKLAMSRQQSLERVIKGSDYLSTRRLDMLLNQKHPPPSFPTLTSNVSSTSRPAGQNGRFKHLNQVQASRPPKCEKWFKDNGLIKNGSQLGTRAITQVMGFPSSWFEGLTEQYSSKKTTPSQTKPQAESEQGISQDEPLHQPKQPLPSAESLCEAVSFRATSTQLLGGEEKLLEHEGKSSSLSQELSIPCLVKQPKRPEVKGVIRKDESDRFLVYISSANYANSISKLFVYPNLDNCSSKKYKTTAAEQGNNVLDTSVKCFSKTVPPSKKSFSKTRRQKGEGSGHIYYRTVTRNGKSYRQAYYQWRENSKQRTKYISKKLLSRVEEAEAQKLPIAEILILLGGIDKCSSKSSDTSIVLIKEKVIDDSNECSSKVASPSKRRRTKGKGSGWIECKPIKRSGKEYKQYWYHYEEWREGDRLLKKSRYIPRRLVARVEKMETEKVPVREIIKVLQVKHQSKL